MEWVIDGTLARAARPGWPSKDVQPGAVDLWIEDATRLGIRTILCLLADEQLAYYTRALPAQGGLIAYYRQRGFEVSSLPVPDHVPMIDADLARAERIFSHAKAPLLVHCSAGQTRTDAVVRRLEPLAAARRRP